MIDNYTILNNGKLVVESWYGEIPHETIVLQQRTKLEDPLLSENSLLIADLRHAKMPQTNIDNISQIVKQHADNRNGGSFSKMLLIVPEPELFEKATNFRKLMSEIGIEVIMLSSISSVCPVMGLKASDIEQIINKINSNN
jgi:hypothetical protein